MCRCLILNYSPHAALHRGATLRRREGGDRPSPPGRPAAEPLGPCRRLLAVRTGPGLRRRVRAASSARSPCSRSAWRTLGCTPLCLAAHLAFAVVACVVTAGAGVRYRPTSSSRWSSHLDASWAWWCSSATRWRIDQTGHLVGPARAHAGGHPARGTDHRRGPPPGAGVEWDDLQHPGLCGRPGRLLPHSRGRERGAQPVARHVGERLSVISFFVVVGLLLQRWGIPATYTLAACAAPDGHCVRVPSTRHPVKGPVAAPGGVSTRLEGADHTTKDPVATGGRMSRPRIRLPRSRACRVVELVV